MTDQELLKCYTDFVPFLAAVCGPGCEIVIHDVTNPEQSIIAIGNGISGRELGDPMTDLLDQVLRDLIDRNAHDKQQDRDGAGVAPLEPDKAETPM